MEGFNELFLRHPALNLEHGNLLIFILAENLLPDVKKQIEDNVVGWVGQSLDILQVATQYFEELNQPHCFLTNRDFIRTEMRL